jgi:hypothetical protein
MSTHSKRLRNGVKELVRTGDTTLEDLHMVASDVIASLDKLAARTTRKLKCGQGVRVYDEDSNKEYGQKGSDILCFFSESHETKTKGTVLKVYDAKNEWSTGLDCLLEIYDNFDPESEEGKKRNSKAGPKRRGRKPKNIDSEADTHEFDTQWDTADRAFEPEEADEEYNFGNTSDWGEYEDDE